MLNQRIGAAELAELAERRDRREWRIRPADLQRLAALTAKEDEASFELDASAEFSIGSEGFPVMHLIVAGAWSLVCQRCLSPVPHEVTIDGVLTILPDEADAQRVADPFETVVLSDGGLCLVDVIEDELLAGVPLAPMHGSDTNCGRSAQLVTRGAGTEKHTPFADLRGMLRGSTRDDAG